MKEKLRKELIESYHDLPDNFEDLEIVDYNFSNNLLVINLANGERKTISYFENGKIIQQEKIICYECGKDISDDDFATVNDENYCDDCYHDNFFECHHCGDICNIDESCSYNDNSFCGGCFSNNFSACDDCDEFFPHDDLIRVAGDYRVCEGCLDNYSRCERCGDYYSMDDLRYSERNGAYYCDNCYEEENETIHNHSYQPDKYKFYGDKTKDNVYMGVELEVESDKHETLCDDFMNHFELTDEKEIYLKDDSSLERGFEIVSHPRTLESHQSFWSKKLDWLKDNNFVSYNSENCGLHIHVEKDFTQLEQLKLGLFVQIHKHKFEKLGQRTDISYARFIKKEKIKDYNTSKTRYEAVNFLNHNTIEFRFPKGTLRYGSFIGILGVINYLCTVIKKMTIWEIVNREKGWIKFCEEVEVSDILTLDYIKNKNLYCVDKSTWDDHLASIDYEAIK